MVNGYNNSYTDINELLDLYYLGKEENNQTIIKEVFEKIKVLDKKVKKNEIKCFLSDQNDSMNAYLEIHAGAGATESQDWADMLRRMYTKWTTNKKYNIQLIS